MLREKKSFTASIPMNPSSADESWHVCIECNQSFLNDAWELCAGRCYRAAQQACANRAKKGGGLKTWIMARDREPQSFQQWFAVVQTYGNTLIRRGARKERVNRYGKEGGAAQQDDPGGDGAGPCPPCWKGVAETSGVHHRCDASRGEHVPDG